MTDILRKYFPELSPDQIDKLNKFASLLKEWNEKINLISRKDIDNIPVNHLLHSLSIAKFITFQKGAKVMDLGSGGGLPGIPLAILFPDTEFTLIDRTGKKMNAAAEMAKKLGLVNVKTIHGDAAEIKDEFDFIVSRAVMPQPDLNKIAFSKIKKEQRHSTPNGVISLKGGDLTEEIKNIKNTHVISLSNYFDEPFFETKKIVYSWK